ncbi:MAG: hypothetical protein K2P88_03880 [Chitinophagaceae bacterium]|jgi:hypothetical protein|uniref:hypothetical protein n=1 Tax=unclassified Paraflavitalea TaxID=2798305 RepID=UPI003D34C42B|nr:hypothetical protein [Chitinophagaceae bacterium]
MRKAPAILLLVLTAFTLVGGRVLFAVEQVLIKMQQERLVLQSVPNSQLVSFSASDKIIWEEEAKECYYQGDLYDVVRSELKNGQTYYYCVKDGDESELVKNYTSHFPNQQKRTAQISTLTYFFEYKEFSIAPVSFKIIRAKSLFLVSIPEDIHKEILIPPPNC